jgi:FkbM family methyltransferase
MESFRVVLEEKLAECRSNKFGAENFDEYRFGKLPELNFCQGIIKLVKKTIKKTIGYGKFRKRITRKEIFEKYGNGLQYLYEQLDIEGQALLVDLVAFRILGYRKVKLTTHKKYFSAIEKVVSLIDFTDSFTPGNRNFILYRCDLRELGYKINIYLQELGIAIDFILEQYAYKRDGKDIVAVRDGDTVLDLGACWGDTALYFAAKSGSTGKVYSFEFIPENIKVFKLNISLNPDLKDHIELINNPVSKKPDEMIYFRDNGPGSKIDSEPFDEQTGEARTISIDDIMLRRNIPKVDFIKMDIEGAEFQALEGGIETIRKYRPRLAIAIYHSMDDFINIPKWILDLDLGYRIYLGHYTIHSEETILFAKVENE